MKKILISMMLLMSVVAVHAQTENDELTKEIYQIIEASHTSENFNQLMTEQMQALVEQGLITAENVAPLVKEIETNMMPQMKERMAALYKANFTLEELKQINAFFSSTVGQKMQKLTPEFAAEGMKIVQTPEAQNKIQEIFLRYMKKE